MIPSLYNPPNIKTHTTLNPISNGLNRVFAAAVVNRHFRQLLLHEPDTALSTGYLGESFLLTSYERELVLSTHADTLADFARKINTALKE